MYILLCTSLTNVLYSHFSLNPNMRWISERQQQKVPFLMVQTLQEKYLFKKTVAKYILNKELNVDQFADDWNNGALKKHIRREMYNARGNLQHEG